MIRVLNLTMKEAERYKVISEVEEGYLKVKEAAGILGLSQRQVYRIKARVEKEGMGGIIHKSKGKNAPRWLTEKIKDKIDHFYKTKYRGFNLIHLTEYSTDEEGIKVSRESVRQILLGKGSYVKKRRYPKHRRWREPSERVGGHGRRPGLPPGAAGRQHRPPALGLWGVPLQSRPRVPIARVSPL